MAEVCKITRIHKKTLRNHAELFYLQMFLLVVLHAPEPVVSREDASEYRSRNGVPDTRDGARHDSERICGHEEVGRQIRGKAGVLHTHLYRYCPILWQREAEQFAHKEAYQIAEGVMTKHHNEYPQKEHQTAPDEVLVDS